MVMKINVIIIIYLHYNIKINNYFFWQLRADTNIDGSTFEITVLSLHCQYIVYTLYIQCIYNVLTM